MRLCFESRGDATVQGVPGGGAHLVAFMSFAAMRGFGAAHPLIALAERLQLAHGVSLGPLTTFYDARVEDAEDAHRRELSWQPAGPLIESLQQVSAAVGSDPQCAALAARAGAETLGCDASSLAVVLAALPAGAEVRLGYEL